MNVNDTVKRALLRYPRLFKNALDVYNHLFFVYGNGYDWEDGQLVSMSSDEDNKIDNLRDAVLHAVTHACETAEDYTDIIAMLGQEDKEHEIEKPDGTSKIEKQLGWVIKATSMFILKDLREKIPLILDTDARMNDFEPYDEDSEKYSHGILKVKGEKWHMFPMDIGFSYICNFPEDIKADWLSAIDFAAWFLKTHPECLVSMSSKYVDKVLDKTWAKMQAAVKHNGDNPVWMEQWYFRKNKRSHQSFYMMKTQEEFEHEKARTEQESTGEVQE